MATSSTARHAAVSNCRVSSNRWTDQSRKRADVSVELAECALHWHHCSLKVTLQSRLSPKHTAPQQLLPGRSNAFACCQLTPPLGTSETKPQRCLMSDLTGSLKKARQSFHLRGVRRGVRCAASKQGEGAETSADEFDIKRLESYTELAPGEVLSVRANVDGEDDEVIIFKVRLSCHRCGACNPLWSHDFLDKHNRCAACCPAAILAGKCFLTVLEVGVLSTWCNL